MAVAETVVDTAPQSVSTEVPATSAPEPAPQAPQPETITTAPAAVEGPEHTNEHEPEPVVTTAPGAEPAYASASESEEMYTETAQTEAVGGAPPEGVGHEQVLPSYGAPVAVARPRARSGRWAALAARLVGIDDR